MPGVKETKEALVGVFEVSIFIAERLKDGIGVDDAFAIFDKLKNDDDFKNKIAEAYKGVEAVSEEIKDLDAQEGVDLALLVVSYVPKFLDAFKKDE